MATPLSSYPQVRRSLSSAPDPDAVVDAVPGLAADPVALARTLTSIATSRPGSDPLQVGGGGVDEAGQEPVWGGG